MSGFSLEEIRSLSEIMQQSGLTMLECNDERGSLKLERQPVAAAGGTAAAAPAAAPASSESAQQTAGRCYASPMVGVFYAAPAPGEKPFVQVGDQVKKGEVICIVEAMKLMNEVMADSDGEIVEVCVKNGDVVEYGQPLFRIK